MFMNRDRNVPKEVVLKRQEKKTLIVLSDSSTTVRVRLIGEGAAVKVIGILIGRNGETGLTAEVVHEAPGTVGEIVLRGVVFDGKAVVKGSVKILKGAPLSRDELREDLLLVGDKARGEAYPYLEIEENDVSAKHAATVGRIDREQLFYLLSRGVSGEQAQRMIIQGFLSSVIQDVPEEQGGKIRAAIQTALEGGGQKAVRIDLNMISN
jgi:Fe-S cluster assembly protein SufD